MAFSDGLFLAFAKLWSIKWTRQQLDVFANKIGGLAGIAGFTNDGLNNIVRLAFVNGFPDNINVKLQQASHIVTMPTSDIISRARILNSKIVEPGVAAVSLGNRHIGQVLPSKTGQRDIKIKCFRCGGAHMIKNSNERIRCFKCNNRGIWVQMYQLLILNLLTFNLKLKKINGNINWLSMCVSHIASQGWDLSWIVPLI